MQRTTDSPFTMTLDKVPDRLRGGVVAIGNFDGVHRGHQAVLGAALAAGRPTAALTFEPHPRAFFSGRPLFRLTPPAVKAHVMAALGLDAMVVGTFDAAFAALSADAFIEEIIVRRFGAKAVVVGHDFNYGAKRSGGVATLQDAGRRNGFSVEVVDEFTDARGAISSSRIRKNLAAADLDGAAALLGYRYRVEAPIIHGEKRGRTMNYPTANQSLGPDNELAHGIYAVRIEIDGVWRDGAASYGRRPTFDNGAPLLETFVFDFEGDLYGKTLPVTFVKYLRPEIAFTGMEALIEQMDADSRAARAALAEVQPISALDRTLNF
ncbi:bifunctional riboflavin kinase/FAD synthetase [Acuticoccus sp. M5D2P5]|uniref:bifunctional riboflavin kinase/FAD synthetase n=1 Tax=Acuticoccus kalidii TaxID=2910977 RepID=UPI001F0304BC|nr:bifunctional riboflavin kinase/FAD synthetase [Acuticoccus kalidii]MCF3933502.1 bifunctional riboflavin kinase/FAD synthetase [Acuticoccus kalidii]